MLLSKRNSKLVEEYIVEVLHRGGAKGPALLKAMIGKDNTLSKETFYRVLRKLLKDEVINKGNGIYQLNRFWLQKLYQFSKQHVETVTASDVDHILSYNEGDKITYKFKNANLMGIYWAHTYDMIFEKHDVAIPIIIFHPHEWLIYTRKESESFFLNRFAYEKKLVFFAIGGNNPIDLLFKKEWSHKYRQINTGTNYGIKNTEYINILGDFIFKVTTSKKFADDIEKFFKNNTEINERNIMEIEKLCNRKDTMRMTFTRSKKEADKWRIKFKKHFYTLKK